MERKVVKEVRVEGRTEARKGGRDDLLLRGEGRGGREVERVRAPPGREWVRTRSSLPES